MTKSIWVIEQGSYSDYRVVGVYSSKENADAIAELLNADDDSYERAEVAEWPLDPGANEMNQGMRQFNVFMLIDGEVESVEPYPIIAFYLLGCHNILKRSGMKNWNGKADCLHSIVWATDEKHAIKIVNEKRLQMRASGEWEHEGSTINKIST